MEYKGKTARVLNVSNENSSGFGAIGLTGEILRCEKGRGFAIVSPSGEFLRTSRITSIEPSNNKLTIKTLNSEYLFEIKEEK